MSRHTALRCQNSENKRRPHNSQRRNRSHVQDWESKWLQTTITKRWKTTEWRLRNSGGERTLYQPRHFQTQLISQLTLFQEAPGVQPTWPKSTAHLTWEKLMGCKQQERGKGKLQSEKSPDDCDSAGVEGNSPNRSRKGREPEKTPDAPEVNPRENPMELTPLKHNSDNQEILGGWVSNIPRKPGKWKTRQLRKGKQKVVQQRKSNHSLLLGSCEQGLLSHNYENTDLSKTLQQSH